MTNSQEDPDSTVVKMRLRPEPRPVLRLSRKMLMGAGAIAAIAISTALGFALLPQKTAPQPTGAAETTPTHSHPATEALNALPKDYTSAPTLGPPLPGDLGRPLLAAQSAGAVPPQSATTDRQGASVPDTSPSPVAQARETAHKSQLFLAQAGTQGSTGITAVQPSATPALEGQLADLTAWSPPATPAATPKSEPDRKRSFLNLASDQVVVSDQRLTDPASPYLLLTGSVVPAALITGINSDIPGQVLAQVTQDVHDSLSGRYLLIPKGSRLIGQYDNSVSFGQSRLLLTWSRLILPSGKSLVLDHLSGADTRGFAGLNDKTDYHWAGVAGAAAVSTLLSVGAQAGEDHDSDLIRALRDGASDSVTRAGQRVVERQLSIQPTLTIRPGLPVRVILTRDLILEPYGD
jgi:type IV secretory pathway VirB10-like protein